jgi:SAM-dependent methyltransferase
MPTLMESKTSVPQHALIKAVLAAQTNSLGALEAPLAADLLRAHKCRTVLDVGCGEGSFLLNLAARAEGERFLGIDHNELAIRDARRGLRRRALTNVKFETAFFDPVFSKERRDAVLTRYTLQHSSDPETFLKAVRARLKSRGLFVAMESLDGFTDGSDPDPVWRRYRLALAGIHKRIGSDANIGRTLGRRLRTAGFREVRVWVALCAPSTVGWPRFRRLIASSAELAHGLFPDRFDAKLFRDLAVWLSDRPALERKDPCVGSAIACGTKP